MIFIIVIIQGVSKNLLESGEQSIVSKNFLESGEQYIVVSFFGGCLTRRVINAAMIVLFKSIIKLNNFALDKKHNL